MFDASNFAKNLGISVTNYEENDLRVLPWIALIVPISDEHSNVQLGVASTRPIVAEENVANTA